ncbi:hypothetical protein [Neptuniibacter sp. QD34_54]|uniref:hypothetical protein n=1 Tax=unclassified Neptuniibacter TaxID=2630693 RepID=UPI0039F664C6
MSASASALAHYPVMTCEQESAEILCHVGFSDGTKAVGKPVKLYDYDETLLVSKKADKFSQVRFKQPEGEFYIQFDSGHEFPVEVDYGEL